MPTRNLGPIPHVKRWRRDFDKHGHHRECDCSLEAMDRDENHICTCRELDESDYHCACEERHDAWACGDYADGDEP